jgi:hypothetical protein
MRFVIIGVLRLARLSIMLPILLLLNLPIRLPIRLLIRLPIKLPVRLLVMLLAMSILRFRARILLIRAVVAWLGCVFHSEIFNCHFKSPVGGIH